MKEKDTRELELIRAQGLGYSYGSLEVVKGVDLCVNEGEIVALTGANGSGKTTLMKMLCGILTPLQGNICIDGFDMKWEKKGAMRSLGYMSQTNALLERMTAWENYRFYGAVNSMTSKECRKSFSLASGYFGLDRFRNKRVEELTAGWKQLLSFSIAVMSMPKVLLLDEPTAGVDALTRESIWNSVREMVRNGCCAVVTSHYRWEVGLCDRELVIERRTH